MGVEYGEKSASERTSKAPIAENSSQMAAWSPLFSTLLGGIPRKEWAKQEITWGWNAEKPSFSIDRMWRNTSHANDAAYKLSTFSVFHFFSEMSSRSVRRRMRTNKAVFPSPAALYPSDAREKCRPTFIALLRDDQLPIRHLKPGKEARRPGVTQSKEQQQRCTMTQSKGS